MSAFGILFPILGALIAVIGVVVAVANLVAGPELWTRAIALLYLIAIGRRRLLVHSPPKNALGRLAVQSCGVSVEVPR